MMQNAPSDSDNNKVDNDPNAGAPASTTSVPNMMQNNPNDSDNNKIDNNPNAGQE